jgi:hypothetical protein
VQAKVEAPPQKPEKSPLIAKAEPAPKPVKRLIEVKPAPVTKAKLVKTSPKPTPPRQVASSRKPLVLAEARRAAKSVKTLPQRLTIGKPAKPAPAPKIVKPPIVVAKAKPQHPE